MISKITLALFVLLPSLAMAGQSGYIRHGQTFIVYKDGKKVGDWPADEKTDTKVSAKDKAEDRAPAAAPITNDTLYFIDDTSAGSHTVRCYAISNAMGFNKSEPISCAIIN